MVEARRKNLSIVVRTAAAVLLLLPLLAMQLTDEVVWTLSDFVIFALMLAGVVAGFEFAARRSSNGRYRLAAGIALVAGFLLLWINGAVGLFGEENEAANRVFPAVIAVAIVGALIARLEPAGLYRAMIATAIAQLIAAFVAWRLFPGTGDGGLPIDALMLTVFFAGLWLVSAWLFRSCSRETEIA